ncbi:MAG: arabinofuranosyltransferase, partial [Bradymonadia bacterium]
MNANLNAIPARALTIVAVLLPCMLLGVHAALLAGVQGAFCIDDAYITFQYARNVVDGHGPVFNPGERVEGYTNFFWMLLLSGLHAARTDLEVSSRVLAFVFALALIIGGTGWLSRRHSPMVALTFGALLALDASFARWSQDGLETVMFCGLVVLGAMRRQDELTKRSELPVSVIFFVLAALTRPEGYLVFALSWFVGLFRGSPLRDRAKWAGLEAAAFLVPTMAHVGWRFAYYGMWLPNTFYAKVGTSGAQVDRGIDYTTAFLFETRGLLILAMMALVGLTIRRKPSIAEVWAGSLALCCIGYVTAVGGDWMGPGRFLVPAVPLLLLAVLPRLDLLSGRTLVAALAALAIAGSVSGWRSHTAERESLIAERPLSEARTALGQFFAEQAPEDARILTGEIGAIAWFSERYVLDLYGLIDPHLARIEVDTMGEGRAGHEKVDLDYSLALAPTI